MPIAQLGDVATPITVGLSPCAYTHVGEGQTRHTGETKKVLGVLEVGARLDRVGDHGTDSWQIPRKYEPVHVHLNGRCVCEDSVPRPGMKRVSQKRIHQMQLY